MILVCVWEGVLVCICMHVGREQKENRLRKMFSQLQIMICQKKPSVRETAFLTVEPNGSRAKAYLLSQLISAAEADLNNTEQTDQTKQITQQD